MSPFRLGSRARFKDSQTRWTALVIVPRRLIKILLLGLSIWWIVARWQEGGRATVPAVRAASLQSPPWVRPKAIRPYLKIFHP